jgi:6,7-dimethyl-8-ribityllumazine synthase
VRFAVIRSRFNGPITQGLLDGARRGFAEAKIESDLVDVFEVPGSFELPVAALWAAQTKKYNAVVCLGCVIRGDTPHFEYVAGQAARGIADAALKTGIPVIFGVLTTETEQQARERSAADGGSTQEHMERSTSVDRPHGRIDSAAPSNKGYDAACSAVAMAQLRRKFD